MQLDIVTPDRRVHAGETSDVIVPGINGELEVLPGHAPLLSILATGILSFKSEGRTIRLMVSGGFLEVDQDRVTLMTESAALAEEVQPEEERKALHHLEQQLKALGAVSHEDPEFQRMRAEVDRAAAKLQLIK